MSSDKKIFDDIARVAGGAVNVMSGLQQQVRDDIRSRFEEFTGRLDLIARHEFDDLQAVVKALHAKIAQLEKSGSHKASAVKKATKAATGAKRKVVAKAKTAKKSVKKSVKKKAR